MALLEACDALAREELELPAALARLADVVRSYGAEPVGASLADGVHAASPVRIGDVVDLPMVVDGATAGVLRVRTPHPLFPDTSPAG